LHHENTSPEQSKNHFTQCYLRLQLLLQKQTHKTHTHTHISAHLEIEFPTVVNKINTLHRPGRYRYPHGPWVIHSCIPRHAFTVLT